MARKWFFGVAMVALLAVSTVPAVAQESAVKGNLGGTVYDSSGAVVPGAKVTITGPIGSKSMESDGQGNFLFQLLTLGKYSVKVEKTGFKVAEVKNVEVFTNRMTSIRVTLEPGAIAETIEVNAPAVTVDPTGAGVGANLHDTFYQQVPVARNVAGLFYLSAGVASGGGTGTQNPSISGGSGLENLYVADGVNITDAAFGGFGVFSRNFGSVGTGINLSFVKEVQVKTGGYEPQYGRSTGGIVQIVTKSGSRDFHGALAGYFSPQEFEAERTHADDSGRINRIGKILHQQSYEGSAELGGYIPGARDRVFWFGSFNPTRKSDFALSPKDFGLSRLGPLNQRTNTYNYAFKGTVKLTDSHQLESSIFGDPSHTSTSALIDLVMDNNTGFSRNEFGTRNWAFRYNGTLSPTWLVNASVTWGFNEWVEKPGFQDIYGITDLTQTGPGQRGRFRAVGYGFFEPTESNTFGFNADTSKMFRLGGQHMLTVGYRLERPFYDGRRPRTGPRFPIPATNATGLPSSSFGVPASARGATSDATFELRLAAGSCTLCPFMNIAGVDRRVFLRQVRGEFGSPTFETNGTYHAAYGNDSWSISKYITLNAGLRWEEQVLRGQDISYAFTGNWSPRVGVIVDPLGNRKMKIFGNFGRYNYGIPLDLAERSLSNEKDVFGARWAPDFTEAAGRRVVRLNQYGTVTPVLDAAHLLNRAAGGTGGALLLASQSTTGIAPGTKMEYVDEFVVGFEREFKGGVIFSARYIDRRMKRIVEDAGGIPPEALDAGVNQEFLIGNLGRGTDLFTNPIAHTFAPGGKPNPACDPDLVNPEVTDNLGNVLGAVCYEALGKNKQPAGGAIPDGISDGFPNPVRIYQAVELEANKAFSRNWQLRANWRIAKLFGNFEGAFRNDNGQTDPSISSLFDFVEGDFGLLGDQFKPGVLNTDRRHIVNVYTSYVLDKTKLRGLTLGTGVRVDSGIPINRLKAHPAYLNAGEVPVGGRGVLGRTPVSGSVDVHVDYPISFTERMKLRLGIDLFNIANARRVLRIDEREDISFLSKNEDFQKPRGFSAFQRPFFARAMIKFEF